MQLHVVRMWTVFLCWYLGYGGRGWEFGFHVVETFFGRF